MQLIFMKRAVTAPEATLAVAEKTRAALAAIYARRDLPPGARVAITAGSRGIANYLTIIRTAVEFIRERGGKPFLVPAMGSHGGGTVAGRRAVLAGLGITEESVGAPVLDLPMKTFFFAIGYENSGTETQKSQENWIDEIPGKYLYLIYLADRIISIPLSRSMEPFFNSS